MNGPILEEMTFSITKWSSSIGLVTLLTQCLAQALIKKVYGKSLHLLQLS